MLLLQDFGELEHFLSELLVFVGCGLFLGGWWPSLGIYSLGYFPGEVFLSFEYAFICRYSYFLI